MVKVSTPANLHAYLQIYQHLTVAQMGPNAKIISGQAEYFNNCCRMGQNINETASTGWSRNDALTTYNARGMIFSAVQDCLLKQFN